MNNEEQWFRIESAAHLFGPETFKLPYLQINYMGYNVMSHTQGTTNSTCNYSFYYAF